MSTVTLRPAMLMRVRSGERRVVRFDWTESLLNGVTLAFSRFAIHGLNTPGQAIEQAIVGVSYDQQTQAITYTTATPHGFNVNDIVTIDGASIWQNNGQFSVDLVPSPTTFRLFGTFGSTSSGTLTVTGALDEATVLFDPPYNALFSLVRITPGVVGSRYELVNTIQPSDLGQTLEQRLLLLVQA